MLKFPLFTLLVISLFNNVSAESNSGQGTRASIYIAEQAIKVYKHSNGNYPTQEQGFEYLVNQGVFSDHPKDDWGDHLIYHYPAGTETPLILSSNYHNNIIDYPPCLLNTTDLTWGLIFILSIVFNLILLVKIKNLKKSHQNETQSGI